MLCAKTIRISKHGGCNPRNKPSYGPAPVNAMMLEVGAVDTSYIQSTYNHDKGDRSQHSLSKPLFQPVESRSANIGSNFGRGTFKAPFEPLQTTHLQRQLPKLPQIPDKFRKASDRSSRHTMIAAFLSVVPIPPPK